MPFVSTCIMKRVAHAADKAKTDACVGASWCLTFVFAPQRQKMKAQYFVKTTNLGELKIKVTNLHLD
jgi:hypothetical protein